MNTEPTILLIGATGQVGREVAQQLEATGMRARALIRAPEKAAALRAAGFDPVVGSLDQPASLKAALEQIEKVFLLSSDDPRQVELQGALIVAAQAVGVQHIVKLSAHSAGADPPVSFGRQHAQIERQIEASGMAFTHLRPRFFMQNFLSFAPTISANGAFYAPLGSARVSMVDVRDVAAVAVAALTQPGHTGKVYDLSGPEALSFNDAATRLTAALGRQVAYIDVPFEAARQTLIAMGMPGWFADNLIELYTFIRAGGQADVRSTVADVTHRPPHSFAQFADDYAAALRGS